MYKFKYQDVIYETRLFKNDINNFVENDIANYMPI